MLCGTRSSGRCEQGVYPKKLAGGHTIVGCDVASCALVAGFLEEFFHEDHGYNIMHLVNKDFDSLG